MTSGLMLAAGLVIFVCLRDLSVPKDVPILLLLNVRLGKLSVTWDQMVAAGKETTAYLRDHCVLHPAILQLLPSVWMEKLFVIGIALILFFCHRPSFSICIVIG